MNRRSQKSWAAAFLVLCFVVACLLPLGTAYFVSAEEVCTHEHGVLLMTKQATCIEEGYSLYYCPDCGEDYTIDIPGLADHQYWSVSSVYSNDGELIEDHVQCSICGHEDILYFNGGSDTPTVTNGNTLPGWAIALIVIAAILAVGGVATGITLYWKKIKENN